MSHLKSVTLTP